MTTKIIDTIKIYQGKVFDLSSATVKEGDLTYQREIIEHNDSAVLVPIHSNGEISLVRQYRHAAGDYLLELPAGTVEDGETVEQCAIREIEEETGFRAGKLEKLTEFYVSPGILTEKMHIFAASDLTKTQQNTDPDEKIEVIRIDIAKALTLIGDGTIQDAKSIIGILLAPTMEKPDN